MATDHENELLQWDLYKSYGEFNMLFERVISQFRELLISMIRISYNYEDEEDEDENELPDIEQDRLIKILISNMGAGEIVESCKACFIDFYDRQKEKDGNYFTTFAGDKIILSIEEYKLSLEVFKKCMDVIKLRNVIIHSHYFDDGGRLYGRKDFKTSKGYVERNYKYDIDYFEIINRYLHSLISYVRTIKHNLYINRSDQIIPQDFLEKRFRLTKIELENMDLEPPIA